MMRASLALIGSALAALAVGCGDNHAIADAAVPDAQLEGFQQPDIVCPGSPSCMSAGDGVLKVGAAAHVYTPQNFETYTDENMDRKWESTEPYTDLNGNGKFDGIWLFGGGRAAEGVTTDVEARALAFIQGDTTIAIVYVDCIGLLLGDMDRIRQSPILAGYDIDHIVVGATHAHDAPDSVGLWGPDTFTTGREQFVADALVDAAATAVKDAIDSAQPATMVIGSTKLLNDPSNPSAGTDQWNKDIRDPVIFDPTLTVARFVAADNSTIGTLVNWGDHPEVAHFDDTVQAQITAHYPHWLRQHVEQGVLQTESAGLLTADLPGLGGVTVFVQGALGGQIGSLADHNVGVPGPDGTPVIADSNAKDQAIGTDVAVRALQTLRDHGETVSDLPLSIKSAVYNARIDNTLFQVAFLVNLIAPHVLVGYDPTQSLEPGINTPWMPLRATYIQIGPLGIETVPGELHPELWVGGYDQSWTWGYQFYDPTKPNLPDFSSAPQAPYMRDLVLAQPGVTYPVVAGLAEDYIGYIVPAYNYALDPDNPYIVEAAGDHYEEVYSLGPLVEEHAIWPVLDLLKYRAPGQ